MKFFGILAFLGLSACASAPPLKPDLVRPWSKEISEEYPGKNVLIAHYRTKEGAELFFLTANHSADMDSETLKKVKQLFKFKFNALVIESIPFDSGESPPWFLDQALESRKGNVIGLQESGLGAILAHEKAIPFFAGEPNDQEISQALHSQGFTDEDLLGFYFARQIPEWIRQHENPKGLLELKGPAFIESYCRKLQIKDCPDVVRLKQWYKDKNGRELNVKISNEDLAPYDDGALFTQKISSAVGKIRDRFILGVISSRLKIYKKIAVIYGAGHFITLRKSFDEALGEPGYIH